MIKACTVLSTILDRSSLESFFNLSKKQLLQHSAGHSFYTFFLDNGNRTQATTDFKMMQQRLTILTALIRCAVLLGCLAIIFGPPSTSLFLEMLYSRKWSDTQAPIVLAFYCPYIALMAINGKIP